MPKLSQLLKPQTIGQYTANLIAENKYPHLKECVLIPDEEIIRTKKGVVGGVRLSFHLIKGNDVQNLGMAFTDEEIKVVSDKFEFIRELIHEMLATLDKSAGESTLLKTYEKHVETKE